MDGEKESREFMLSAQFDDIDDKKLLQKEQAVFYANFSHLHFSLSHTHTWNNHGWMQQ